jgi:hypothetical protein
MVEAITSSTAPAASGGGGSTLIIGAIVLIILGLIVVGVLIYVAYRVYKWLKVRNDLLYQVRKERLKLCRAQRVYGAKHWLFAEKNPPIRLFYYRWQDGKPYPLLSRPVAYYRGSFFSNDGNLMISIYVPGNRILFIIPRSELLVINNKPERTINIGRNTYTYKLPTAKEMVEFRQSPDEVILYADGISDVGNIYVPVIRDAEGDPIDMATFAIDSMHDVAMPYHFNEMLNRWSEYNKKAVDTNPYVRIANKTSDSNMSVEQQNQGMGK